MSEKFPTKEKHQAAGRNKEGKEGVLEGRVA